MVMSVTLTVGGNVYQLVPITFIGKPAHQAVGELLAIIEQSHPLGLSPESMLEVSQAPNDLRFLVTPVCEWHDQVVVSLRQCRSVPAKRFPTLDIGFDHTVVHLRCVLL